MFKFEVGDLVALLPGRLGPELVAPHAVGVVVEVKELEYIAEDARMKTVTALFGDEKIVLSENDFVLLQKLNEDPLSKE
jgi:hypothetical protein